MSIILVWWHVLEGVELLLFSVLHQHYHPHLTCSKIGMIDSPLGARHHAEYHAHHIWLLQQPPRKYVPFSSLAKWDTWGSMAKQLGWGRNVCEHKDSWMCVNWSSSLLLSLWVALAPWATPFLSIQWILWSLLSGPTTNNYAGCSSLSGPGLRVQWGWNPALHAPSYTPCLVLQTIREYLVSTWSGLRITWGSLEVQW